MVLSVKQMYMKRVNVIALMLICFLLSCNNQQQAGDSLVANSEATTLMDVNLLGSFVGSFGDNKITLLITKTTGDSVSGRSIVGGYDRPFSGNVNRSKGVYHILVNEPGDEKHDGIFTFSIDSKTPDELKGNWAPYRPTTTINAKDYTLKRKAFTYLKDVGEFPEASNRLLKEEDVNNLPKDELQYMRNEIFARHGYCFKMKKLREDFEIKDWYIPNTVDVKKDLTDIEIKNITLIKKYEKYAEEFGDDFGR
jgi:hypothetical protein